MTERLFVAAELPPTVRGPIARFGAAAAAGDPALRSVGDDALHLTLAFLGHREAAEREAARAALRPLRHATVELSLGAPLWLAPRRPHVLALAVTDPSGSLAALHGLVGDALAAALRHEPEPRPFRPHVTVGRVRRGRRPHVDDLPEAPAATFAIASVALLRSHLGAGPGHSARYELLERVELGRPAI